MKQKFVLFRFTPVIALFLLLCAITYGTAVQAKAPAVPATPHGLLTSNGIWVETGLSLPVFQFSAPQVSGAGATSLASNFAALGSQDPQQDNYVGHPRFSILNSDTNTLLEQYGATGGFYAFNPSAAFTETVRGGIDSVLAQQFTCEFLLTNEIFPDNDLISTPNVQFCDYNFNANPYNVSLIYAATQGTPAIAGGETVIGAVVQVPMSLNTGQYSQVPQVPLGGAGGHLSLLFNTTNVDDQGFSLDEGIPGLGAVAMPFYGRSLSFLDNFPSVDPVAARDAVVEMVQNSYPDATEINVPDPALIYNVGDAAQPQKALEPLLDFGGIEVLVGGETIVLRNIMVPALASGPGGFGPDVAITDPASNSTYMPNTAVSFTGVISAGVAPYTYTWGLNDGSLLDANTLAASGSVNFTADSLPYTAHGTDPASVTVVLQVEDSLGAVRQASITLTPAVAPYLYLPLVTNGSSNLTASAWMAKPQAVTAVYRFGVEAGSDYPPYGSGGSDLPGVVPDASGFRTGMLNYGWTAVFNWWNAAAWERDWRDCSLGGGDCTYGVDRVDFAYYAGHGGAGGLSLPSSVDSSWFDGSNARYSTLRWAGFASCQTLRAQWPTPADAPIRRWFGAFQGAHMLLGFNSNMADVAFGPRLVDNMRMPSFLGITFPWAQRTIREAWVQTAFQMNAGKPAYIYAVGTNGVNPADNKLPRSGDPALPRPYPVASYHWVWWNE